MENSSSTSAESGWQAHHLILKQNHDHSVAAIFPLFIKTHSYGEYIFDWSWAEAYHRHGQEYYPKLLNAIPFTPATGPRWAIRQDLIEEHILRTISQHIIEESIRINASSIHCLYSTKEKSQLLGQENWQQRLSYQYHWFNDNYQNFDDFLSTMSSRKRKNIIKERKKIKDQNISLIIKTGTEITQQDWEDFYLFYQMTYLKRSGHGGYLSPSFFPLLAKTMSQHIVMIQAHHENNAVAAALFFKDSTTLYGRYWGCRESYNNLHFEACYYQGIEYAISQGIQRFDPGAQGEHKIQRGFKPIETYSNHWIDNDEFRLAIEKFLDVEASEVKDYIKESSKLLPFKADI